MNAFARLLAISLLAVGPTVSAETGTISKADLEVISRQLTSPQRDTRISDVFARALNVPGSSGQMAQMLIFQALDGKVHYFLRLPKNAGYVLGVKEQNRPLYALRVTRTFKLQAAIANDQRGPITVPLADQAPVAPLALADAQSMLVSECEWWTVYATVRR